MRVNLIWRRVKVSEKCIYIDKTIIATASLLIDLMVKNNLQERCGQEMIQVLEQISLENKESAE